MSTFSEEDVAKRIADKYKNDGYTIILNPKRQDLPFDLGNYLPDLLALKGENDGYIFEIKRNKNYISIDQLKEVASSTDSHDGWHFVLVTGDDVLPEETKKVSEENVLSWDQIWSEMEKGDVFITQNEFEIAFWIYWRTIDAMMRNYAYKINLPIERLPTHSLINHLYSEGELSINQFDELNSMKTLRNQIAHGFKTEVKESDAKRIQEIISELIKTWHPN